MASIWILVGLVGLEAPFIAAFLLFIGAVIGALATLILGLVLSLEQVDVKNPHDATGEFWGYFGWWVFLPLVAAGLFVADVRRRIFDG